MEIVRVKNQLDATKYAVLLPQHVLGTNMPDFRPHPPNSAQSKKPNAAQPRRLSRYGHLKAEVIY
jgi:hypothetical protein